MLSPSSLRARNPMQLCVGGAHCSDKPIPLVLRQSSRLPAREALQMTHDRVEFGRFLFAQGSVDHSGFRADSLFETTRQPRWSHCGAPRTGVRFVPSLSVSFRPDDPRTGRKHAVHSHFTYLPKGRVQRSAMFFCGTPFCLSLASYPQFARSSQRRSVDMWPGAPTVAVMLCAIVFNFVH
jgi:hypothetical protein